jgi:hypothetical protein
VRTARASTAPSPNPKRRGGTGELRVPEPRFGQHLGNKRDWALRPSRVCGTLAADNHAPVSANHGARPGNARCRTAHAPPLLTTCRWVCHGRLSRGADFGPATLQSCGAFPRRPQRDLNLKTS